MRQWLKHVTTADDWSRREFFMRVMVSTAGLWVAGSGLHALFGAEGKRVALPAGLREFMTTVTERIQTDLSFLFAGRSKTALAEDIADLWRAEPDAGQGRRALVTRMKKDYQDQRLVNLDGWLVTPTELGLLAVADLVKHDRIEPDAS